MAAIDCQTVERVAPPGGDKERQQGAPPRALEVVQEEDSLDDHEGPPDGPYYEACDEIIEEPLEGVHKELPEEPKKLKDIAKMNGHIADDSRNSFSEEATNGSPNGTLERSSSCTEDIDRPQNGSQNGSQNEPENGSQNGVQNASQYEPQIGSQDEPQNGSQNVSHNGQENKPQNDSQNGSQNKSHNGPQNKSQNGSQDGSQNGPPGGPCFASVHGKPSSTSSSASSGDVMDQMEVMSEYSSEDSAPGRASRIPSRLPKPKSPISGLEIRTTDDLRRCSFKTIGHVVHSCANQQKDSSRKRSSSLVDVSGSRDPPRDRGLAPPRANVTSRMRQEKSQKPPEVPEADYMTPLQRKDAIIRELKLELKEVIISTPMI